MPATLTTNAASSSTNTQASILTDIQAGMTAAGFMNVYDAVTSGASTTLVYKQTFDETKAKSIVFIAITVGNDLGISQYLCDGWDLTAHAGSNTGTTTNRIVFSSDQPITYTCLSHPELRTIIVSSNLNLICPVGYFRPSIKPTWWDESTHVYCFQPQGSNFNEFSTVAASATPYGNNGYNNNHYLAAGNYLNGKNPTNKRDVLATVIMAQTNNPYNGAQQSGISGISSAEIGQGCCAGLSFLDKLQVSGSSSQYTILNPTYAGTIIQTA